MFYYLDGTVALADAHTAVIDCGGVGYKCSVSLHTQAQLTVGRRMKLYTYLNVGEGIFELYGFADLEERNVFTMLIGVSGVGMKVALSILSVLEPSQFMLAVLSVGIAALATSGAVAPVNSGRGRPAQGVPCPPRRPGPGEAGRKAAAPAEGSAAVPPAAA